MESISKNNKTMIDSIITHTSPQGDPIRTINIDDTPYFVGKDVALALGYADPTNALKQHCDDGVVKRHPILDNLGRTQLVRVINEADVYSLIFGSKLPEAKAFKRWVTKEVLPSIRKNGGYLASDPGEPPELLIARALKVADVKLKEYQEQNRQLTVENQLLTDKVEADAPKVRFAEAVAYSDDTCSVGELAKMLCQNSVKIGRNRLFTWLRENKFLDKDNIPLQWTVERGLFRLVEYPFLKPDGSSHVSHTPRVTGKGQQYIIARFLNHHNELPAA